MRYTSDKFLEIWTTAKGLRKSQLRDDTKQRMNLRNASIFIMPTNDLVPRSKLCCQFKFELCLVCVKVFACVGTNWAFFFKIWTSLFYVFRGEVCEDTLRDFLKNKLKILDEIPFERVHRVGKPNEFNTRPRNIVAKFSFFKDRELVRRRVCPLLSPPPLYTGIPNTLSSSSRKKIHYVVAIGSIFTCGTVIIRQAISWRTSTKSKEFN